MTVDTEFSVIVNNKTIEVHYAPTNDFTFLDVCDLEGNILHTTTLNQESDKIELNIDEIGKGSFQIHIVRGGNVFAQNITL